MDFPDGSAVKTPPANARDVGLSPGQVEEQEGPHVRPPSCRAGLQQANQEYYTSSRTAAHLCWSQGCRDEQKDTVISQSGAPGPGTSGAA